MSSCTQRQRIDLLRSDLVLLSVIIPSYNYAPLLPRVVRSVLDQADRRVELLVIDDGSTDSTVRVLERLQGLYGHRLQVIRQPNAGPAAARNRGLRASSGRHVLFLDADDELLPGALEIILDTLDERPSLDMLIGGSLKHQPDGRERLVRPGAVAEEPRQRIVDYLLLKNIAIGHGSMVASRKLLEMSPYPEDFRCAEDIPVFAYLLAHGEVLAIKQPLVRVYKHDGSLRHQFRHDRALGLQLVDEVFDRLPTCCQVLRRRFAAQRCLSLFRGACMEGHRRVAKSYYRRALSFDLSQALRWSYLRKAIRIWGSR